MAGALKREVILAFKNLHRARLAVFKGDERILKDSRMKINEEFRRNKAVTDVSSIRDMIGYANSVATELRTCVVQAEEKEPGVFKLNIRPETVKLDNKPYDPSVEIPRRGKSRKGESTPCCQQSTPCCRETTPCCQESDTANVKVSSSKKVV